MLTPQATINQAKLYLSDDENVMLMNRENAESGEEPQCS
jgi:hypothetical protein